MKNTTAKKILQRYIKSLTFMEKEAIANGKKTDADLYRMDRSAFEIALKKMEGSNA